MNLHKSNTSAAAASATTAYQKKFCGICKAVGKSEEEYTSHFTKSAPGPKGVVICPIILSSVCKCCSKQGHFADHCPKRAEIDFAQKKANAKPSNVAVVVRVKSDSVASSSVNKSSMSVVNRFTLLRDLEDDTEPVLSTPAKKTFASILASPPCAPVKKSACSEIVSLRPSVPVSVKLITVLPVIPKANQTRRSWADTTDSDSGEDEDDE